MVNEGLRLERPVGSRTAVFTLSMAETPLGDGVEPGEPGLPFAFMVALDPRLDGRQHADGFFAADLVIAARDHGAANWPATPTSGGLYGPAEARRTAVRGWPFRRYTPRWWRPSASERSGIVRISAAASTRIGMFLGLAILATFSRDSGPDVEGPPAER